MSNAHKAPMTKERAREIQGAVDRKPNPTPKETSFKARTSRAAEKKKPQ